MLLSRKVAHSPPYIAVSWIYSCKQLAETSVDPPLPAITIVKHHQHCQVVFATPLSTIIIRHDQLTMVYHHEP